MASHVTSDDAISNRIHTVQARNAIEVPIAADDLLEACVQCRCSMHSIAPAQGPLSHQAPRGTQNVDVERVPDDQFVHGVEVSNSGGPIAATHAVEEELLSTFHTHMEACCPRGGCTEDVSAGLSARIIRADGEKEHGGVEEQSLHVASYLRTSDCS